MCLSFLVSFKDICCSNFVFFCLFRLCSVVILGSVWRREDCKEVQCSRGISQYHFVVRSFCSQRIHLFFIFFIFRWVRKSALRRLNKFYEGKIVEEMNRSRDYRLNSDILFSRSIQSCNCIKCIYLTVIGTKALKEGYFSAVSYFGTKFY